MIARGQGMPPVLITRETWTELIDIVHKKAGTSKIPIWKCLFGYYSVCLPSVVTPLSGYAWQLYAANRGFTNETIHTLQRMPALLVDAFRCIDEEIRRIDAVRASQGDNTPPPKVDRKAKYGRKTPHSH